jgi:hypothetical protein
VIASGLILSIVFGTVVWLSSTRVF